MNTFRLLLLSTALLAPACTKGAEAAPPVAPPVTPVVTPVVTPAATPPATPPATAKPAQPANGAGLTPLKVDKDEVVPTPAPAPAAPALAMPSLANLGQFLGGIKDGPTATAAKAPLEALVKQLETTKAAAAPTPAKPDALGGLGSKLADVATKIGISPEVQKQIGTLLENPSVKAVIGDALVKLQGLAK